MQGGGSQHHFYIRISDSLLSLGPYRVRLGRHLPLDRKQRVVGPAGQAGICAPRHAASIVAQRDYPAEGIQGGVCDDVITGIERFVGRSGVNGAQAPEQPAQSRPDSPFRCLSQHEEGE